MDKLTMLARAEKDGNLVREIDMSQVWTLTCRNGSHNCKGSFKYGFESPDTEPTPCGCPCHGKEAQEAKAYALKYLANGV